MNSRQLMASLARKTLVFIAMMFLLSLIVFYVSRLTPGAPLQLSLIHILMRPRITTYCR